VCVINSRLESNKEREERQQTSSETPFAASTTPGSVSLVSLQRFRGGLVVKAHRLVYHSTLGWILIKKKKMMKKGFVCVST